ncbi:MAG: hypothetical protein IZT59_11840 [Verrucomicrobia bacterium]|jgi:hypothetical protein|nr:hypothetical protein [Verrucomicrobiota bacterium]|tara:strand:- start:6558 stop:6758 length:201 start_codon:yes stop_codon:yes gene_type:complete
MEITAEQIRQEAAECHARKVRQANAMADRELFDYSCRISLAGLREDYPDLSESELQEKLRGYLSFA